MNKERTMDMRCPPLSKYSHPQSARDLPLKKPSQNHQHPHINGLSRPRNYKMLLVLRVVMSKLLCCAIFPSRSTSFQH